MTTRVQFPPAEDEVAKLYQAELATVTSCLPMDERLAEMFHVEPAHTSRLFEVRTERDLGKDLLFRASGLALVISSLSRLYQPEAMNRWLMGTNAFLGNQTPLSVLEAGRFSDVMSAIEQESIHSYA